MKKWYLLSLLMTGAIVTSCTTIKSISVDQMLPADMSFPSQVRTVAVVNNLSVPPVRWPENFTYKDVDEVIDGDGVKASEVLAEHIAAGNYFDQVLICDSALRAGEVTRRAASLKQEEVKKLADELGVDMIVSLDAIAVKATPKVIYTLDATAPTGVINVTVESIVRIYLPSRREPLTTLTDRDSIYWLSSVVEQDVIVERASDFAATLPVKHLVPSWKTVDRYIYTGGSADMRDAEVWLKEGLWDNALASWKRMYNSKSKKRKMYAAFNMALYYEIHDDLDHAQEWVRRAMEFIPEGQKRLDYEYGDYALMEYYLAELEERKEEMQRLNLQMNRFEDDF